MQEKNSHLTDIPQLALANPELADKFCGPPEITEFNGDGSSRRFYRMGNGRDFSLIAILPPPGDAIGLREAYAAHRIGTHLANTGAPVPRNFGFVEESGLLLYEDLGSRRLFEAVEDSDQGRAPFPAELYRQTVRALARMQVRGGENFDPAWCWDTPYYDQTVMLERESGYFVRALCIDYLGLSLDQSDFSREFQKLARQADSAPKNFFLHRDFQCRNIMIHEDRPRFIDYQGGRLGPPAYDLASLLIDPYAGLSTELQEELREEYFVELRKIIPYDKQCFQEQYWSLGLQRNLQILGAFSFLSKQRGKSFFAPYITPALLNLQSMLAKVQGDDYPALRNITEKCLYKVCNECR